ncbi:AAA family ATPase [Novosphingobium sp. FSY-8]|uniref:AAA family ATPase n=1 Tax=Novosphingobium ovatum TaxID=1908523 RepID=A0ABW9XA33_9SPHN|nr:ParA family protein [Novosphingobium ovatum]NBC35372.1 AAA family ATPase [Novosphingobium ovatum]
MSVIAVYSTKGGVGKTTLSVDLAWRSAVLGGHKTLLWDLDVQGGAGYLLGEDEQPRLRAAGVFHREGRPDQLICETAYPNLSLLSADDSLRSLQLHLARIGQKRRLANLTNMLRGRYSRIILDCPPLLGEVSDQIIAAADVLIVPLPVSPLSFRALDTLRRELKREHGRHPPLLPVLSMYDGRRKAHRDLREGEMAPYPAIPWSSAIEQTAFRRAPIGTFAPHAEPAQALDRLWRVIEAKVQGARAA